MIPEGKIGPRSVVIMAVLAISPNVFYASSIAADYGLNAAWMVILAAGLLALIASYIPKKLMDRFPQQTITEVGYQVLGKYLGFAAGLMIFNFFLMDSSLSLRLTADRVLTAYMPNTPVPVMMLALLVVGIGGAYLGLEAIARAVVIAHWLLLVTVFVPIVLTVNFWEPDNLAPWLGAGLPAIGIGGLSMIGLFADIFLIAVIYPSISKSQGGNIWVSSVFWGMLLLVITTLGVQLVFPTPVLSETLFPLTQVSRLVYMGRFLQRIDAFIAFFWIGMYAFRFSLVFLLALNTLTQLLRLPYYRPFMFSLGAVVFALGLIPRDIMEATYIVTGIFWRTSWAIVFGLPGIMLLVSLFRKGVKAG